MENDKRRRRKLDHLEQVCKEIKEYNKRNHTNYSYGLYVAYAQCGIIQSELIRRRR